MGRFYLTFLFCLHSLPVTSTGGTTENNDHHYDFGSGGCDVIFTILHTILYMFLSGKLGVAQLYNSDGQLVPYKWVSGHWVNECT